MALTNDLPDQNIDKSNDTNTPNDIPDNVLNNVPKNTVGKKRDETSN